LLTPVAAFFAAAIKGVADIQPLKTLSSNGREFSPKGGIGTQHNHIVRGAGLCKWHPKSGKSWGEIPTQIARTNAASFASNQGRRFSPYLKRTQSVPTTWKAMTSNSLVIPNGLVLARIGSAPST
jgi:hypothetical protein